MDVRATIATDDRAVYRTDHDASVNLYLIMDEYAEQNEQKKNRTLLFNCTQREI